MRSRSSVQVATKVTRRLLCEQFGLHQVVLGLLRELLHTAYDTNNKTRHVKNCAATAMLGVLRKQ